MIQKITFKNYKSFKDETQIEIKPITVLVGPNSAGKSSILRLLAMLSQSIQAIDQNAKLISYSGSLVDTGDFRTNLNRNCPDEATINFNLELTDKISAPGEYQAAWELFGTDEEISFFDGQVHLNIGQDYLNIKIDDSFKNPYLSEAQDEFFHLKDLVIRIIKETEHEDDDECDKVLDNWIKYENPEQLENPHKDLVTKRKIKEAEYEDECDKALDNWVKYENPEQFEKPLSESEIASWMELFPNPHPSSKDIDNDDVELRNVDAAIYSCDIYCQDLIPNIFSGDYQFLEQALMKNCFKEISVDLQPIILTKPSHLANELKKFNESKIITRGLLTAVLAFIKSHPDQGDTLRIFTFWLTQYFMKKFCMSKGLSVIGHLWGLITKCLGIVTFIAPLRPIPKRNYNEVDFIDEVIGRKTISLLQPEDYDNLIERVNNCLNIVNVNYQLPDLRKFVMLSQILSLEEILSQLNFADVGFGISQITPIFFALEILRNITNGDPIILIEQPELHLHPQPQARLAEVFTNSLQYSTDKLSGKPNRLTLLIETHSEHLLRGFQVMVAKGKLKPKDLAVYYVDKNKEGNSFVRLLPVDSQGAFTEVLPDGFFDQGYQQALELIAARKK